MLLLRLWNPFLFVFVFEFLFSFYLLIIYVCVCVYCIFQLHREQSSAVHFICLHGRVKEYFTLPTAAAIVTAAAATAVVAVLLVLLLVAAVKGPTFVAW